MRSTASILAAGLLAATFAVATDTCRLDLSQYNTNTVNQYDYSTSLLDKDGNMSSKLDVNKRLPANYDSFGNNLDKGIWVSIGQEESGFIDNVTFRFGIYDNSTVSFATTRRSMNSDNQPHDGKPQPGNWTFDDGQDWNNADQHNGWVDGRRNAHLDWECGDLTTSTSTMSTPTPTPTSSSTSRRHRTHTTMHTSTTTRT